MKTSVPLIFGLLALLNLTACNKKNSSGYDAFRESAQQIGDVAAAIDESGGASGSLTLLDEDKLLRQSKPLFARYGVSAGDFSLIPNAYASNCVFDPGFGACDTGANTLTRDFKGCFLGALTFSGTVVFTWSGGAINCHMTGAGHQVARNPNFSITYGNLVYSVSKTNSFGQRILWNSGSVPNVNFSFANDGIRRTLSLNGSTVLDYTTITTSSIGITGTNRLGRVVNGGTLRVTNNISGVTCDYSPTAVTWTSANCVCPTSGSWSGTCSDGKVSSLVHTGCGSATYTLGSDSSNINFDRCF
ncbi:MAG: hypothetical protein JST80_12035 [Bdellovibrionales bacterium]|nr:hypothetical protein [Bdellovibrionales bacterium]